MRYCVSIILAVAVLAVCATGWSDAGAPPTFELPMQDGRSLRVSLGEVFPAAALSGIVPVPSPHASITGYRSVTLELSVGDRRLPLMQYLMGESSDPRLQGFQPLAAAFEPGTIIMACTYGPMINVQRIPVHPSGPREDTLLRLMDWSGENYVAPLKPGQVTASLRKTADGKRWLVEIADQRQSNPKRSVFEQQENRWEFRKVE